MPITHPRGSVATTILRICLNPLTPFICDPVGCKSEHVTSQLKTLNFPVTSVYSFLSFCLSLQFHLLSCPPCLQGKLKEATLDSSNSSSIFPPPGPLHLPFPGCYVFDNAGSFVFCTWVLYVLYQGCHTSYFPSPVILCSNITSSERSSLAMLSKMETIPF